MKPTRRLQREIPDLYVSCHPGTPARDAAGVADMFPYTAHAEAMALFAL